MGWDVYFDATLPDGVNGATRWSDRTIWFRTGMSQVKRRCVAEHERQHVIAGGEGLGVRDERAVDVATAHALIALDDLIHAAKWALSHEELADELNVTLGVLRTRLRHLHPAERAEIHRHLGVDSDRH